MKSQEISRSEKDKLWKERTKQRQEKHKFSSEEEKVEYTRKISEKILKKELMEKEFLENCEKSIKGTKIPKSEYSNFTKNEKLYHNLSNQKILSKDDKINETSYNLDKDLEKHLLNRGRQKKKNLEHVTENFMKKTFRNYGATLDHFQSIQEENKSMKYAKNEEEEEINKKNNPKNQYTKSKKEKINKKNYTPNINNKLKEKKTNTIKTNKKKIKENKNNQQTTRERNIDQKHYRTNPNKVTTRKVEQKQNIYKDKSPKDIMTETTNGLPSNFYDPINLKGEFDKKKFKYEANIIGGLEASLKGLKDDPTSPEMFNQASILLKQNPEWYQTIPNASLIIRQDLEKNTKEGNANLEKYVTNNSNETYNLLDTKAKNVLLQSTQLIKEKVDSKSKETSSKYNEFVDAMTELQTISQVAENPELKMKYLQEKIKASPGWAQEMMSMYQGNNAYLDRMFQDYAQDANMGVQKIMYDEKGKPNEKLINAYAKKNLELASKDKKKNKEFFSGLTKLASNAVLQEEAKTRSLPASRSVAA